VPGYVPRLIVRDLETGKETTIEPPSNSHCAISGDGSRIAFTSPRASMAPEDQNDVYVADVATQQLTRITDGTAYVFAPSIWEDGRRIAFATKAALDPADTNDDFDVYVHDLDTGEDELAQRGYGHQLRRGVHPRRRPRRVLRFRYIVHV
jgi:Tol biopolymer transport system component